MEQKAEAIGSVLMYFNRGQLPWQGFQASTKEEKYHKIMESKRSTQVETLCKGYPAVFPSYLNYCRALRFEDRPDYAYLRRLFKDLFMREGFVNDGMFDWSQPTAEIGKEAAEGKQKNSARNSKDGSASPRQAEGGNGDAPPRDKKNDSTGSGQRPEDMGKQGVGGGEENDSQAHAHKAGAGSDADANEQRPPPAPKKKSFLASLFKCGAKGGTRK